ncbi:type VI secretion system accessory protein TagJ [Thiocapsa rosea]|uniref:Type VI secretion system protein ImpE n=1 Tax=Thiocapsa rosea TaxID=69360 RepID=A0A495VEN6_9GAMM|nr:type VI secretion system accessory protein TagJ [Thiocapsa rosea]RKT46288.1 type VI secretion system protein ImpE [Thiocapsa rosea]
MGAEEALKQGDLDAALADLTDRVRRAPADARLRTFLFQLFAVLGQWDRALSQLNVAGELDAGTLAMVSTYRDLLSCEALRAQVFAGERDPLVLGEPAQWVALLFQALRLAAQGRVEHSQALRERALEAAPASSGRIDGEPFIWIADADGRLGPMLEIILEGRYSWVPFQHLRTLVLEEPTDLRDLVWAPAHITWANGGEAVAFVPSRYPGSESSPDPRIRLARLTEWTEQGGELFTGLGQRMLTTDAGDYSLLATRRIEIDPPSEGVS